MTSNLMMEYLVNILASNFFKSHCDNHSTLHIETELEETLIY